MRRRSWMLVGVIAVAALVVILVIASRIEPTSSDVSAAPTERVRHEYQRSVVPIEFPVGDLRDELLAHIDQLGQRIDGLDTQLGDLRKDVANIRMPHERSALPIADDSATRDERQRAVMQAVLDEEAERARVIQLEHWTRVMMVKLDLPPERMREIRETIARHGILLLRLERKLPDKSRVAGISNVAVLDCQKEWVRFAKDLEDVLDSRPLAQRCLLFLMCDGDTYLYDAMVSSLEEQVGGYFSTR